MTREVRHNYSPSFVAAHSHSPSFKSKVADVLLLDRFSKLRYYALVLFCCDDANFLLSEDPLKDRGRSILLSEIGLD